MSDNRYAPPNAKLDDRSVEPDVPDQVRKEIRGAWIAGLISGGITLAVTLFSMFGSTIGGIGAENLVDVAMILGFTYGIYKKSRACAIAMLVYFVASKIYLMLQMGKPSGLWLGLVFSYYFALGVRGTFAYHRLRS
jgi:serine/threonine-protein kinase